MTPGLLSDLRTAWFSHGRSTRHLGFWALATYRFGREALDIKNPMLRRAASAAYGVCAFVVDVNSGVELNREARIGADFHLVHGWNIKVHPDCVIGSRVSIMHDVTLGTNMGRPGAPSIGDDVFIGAGARVLGGVHIGQGAHIAANSLVINDVPAGATAVGVPARVMLYTGRPPAERRHNDRRRRSAATIGDDQRHGDRRRPRS